MDQSTSSIILALVAILSTVVATTFAANARTQVLLVKALEKQVTDGQGRETTCDGRCEKLAAENRSNMETIFKLVGAVEKLTDEQARGTQLLGDLVYGRTEHRRS